MSLINDALKQLQAAQRADRPGPADPAPPWHPAPSPGPRPSSWTLVGFGLLLGAGLFFIGAWWHDHIKSKSPPAPPQRPPVARDETAGPDPLHGSNLSATDTPAHLQPPTGTERQSDVAPEVARQPADLQPPSPAAHPQPTGQTPPETANPNPHRSGRAAGPPTEEPVAPPVPDLKLQAVIYHPNRPWAVVNQKTVQPGDVVEGWTVLRIEPERIVLTGHGRTNVLELP
ncbi:hypothetical protein ACPDIX_14635 [Limisphaera sp. 4302-co]